MSIAGALKAPTTWRGAPEGYSAYAPNPHKAEDFASLASPSQTVILAALQRAGKRTAEDVWVCGQHSYAAIARATRLHWTTVATNVAELRAKQMLDTREVWSRDKAGGRRVGTLYSVPSFKDALERRRRIPGAAVTPDGHVLFIGRARRPMTIEQALAWSIDLERVPSHRAPAPATHQNAAAVTQTRPPRQVGKMPAPPDTAADEAAILAKLRGYCPANERDAADLLDAARGAAGAIPLEVVIAEMVKIRERKAQIDAKKRVPDPFVTPKWFIDRMPSHVHDWLAAERVRAKDSERKARAERDARLNHLAEIVAAYSQLRGDGEALPDGLSEREFLRQQLAAADPAELDEARALVSNSRTMRA